MDKLVFFKGLGEDLGKKPTNQKKHKTNKQQQQKPKNKQKKKTTKKTSTANTGSYRYKIYIPKYK